MRTLYHLWLHPSSRKVRIALAEKKLDFDLKIEKVWERRTEFLAINPAGDVPVLIEPDGTILTDSQVISEYLNEVYNSIDLMGRDPLQRAESAPPGRLVRPEIQRRGDREPRRREDDEALPENGGAARSFHSRRPCQHPLPPRLHRVPDRAPPLAGGRRHFHRRRDRRRAPVRHRLYRRRAMGRTQGRQGLVCRIKSAPPSSRCSRT